VATWGTVFALFALYKIRKWRKQPAIEEDATEPAKKKK